MRRLHMPADAEEKFEYVLRVLRLLSVPGEAGDVLKTESPPEALKRGFAEADREYDRLVSTIDSKYYHEFAVPANLDIGLETARSLSSSLRMEQLFPGVLGPRIVRYRQNIYKVWMLVFPCG